MGSIQTDEVTMDDVREQFGNAGLLHSTMVYNRLITLLSGGALVIHNLCQQSAGTRSGGFYISGKTQ